MKEKGRIKKFASPRPVRVAAATGHGEWSRRGASDIDGLSREAERSGSDPSVGGEEGRTKDCISAAPAALDR
jgi:hypothetical protein